MAIEITSLSDNQHVLIDDLVVSMVMCDRVGTGNVGKQADLVVCDDAVLDDDCVVRPHVESEIRGFPYEKRFEF